MTHAQAISRVDQRPFFEKALAYGLKNNILNEAQRLRIEAEAPKGLVQIANHFGTAYLRTELESAVVRMVNLISLYLEEQSDGDLQRAALSLRDNSLLSHSRGGSEMLKRLHAMPEDTLLLPRAADPAGQKAFVNERSFAFPLSVAAYREQFAQRQANQAQIDFARWLARQFNTAASACEDHSAQEIIHSAMLVLSIDPAGRELPSKAQFVKLLASARKKGFKAQTSAAAFLRDAPELFATMTTQALQTFCAQQLPALIGNTRSADEILHGTGQDSFFIRDTPEDDVVAYDRLVAREWVRVTKGEGDDPAVLASIFLAVATGHPAKAAVLLREAKSIIATFRTNGFDSAAVLAFIDAHAPFEQREDLKALWLEDLQPEASVHLADNDAQMPDSHMERALKYFRQTCATTWKGRD